MSFLSVASVLDKRLHQFDGLSITGLVQRRHALNSR